MRVYVKTNDGLREAAEHIRQQRICAVDCETYSIDRNYPNWALDPYRNKIRLIQLATPFHSYVIDLFCVRDLEPFKQIMRDPTILKLGQALHFENKQFMHHLDGLWIENCFDTIIASRMLEKFAKIDPITKSMPSEFVHTDKLHNLEILADRYLNEELNKDEQTSYWGEPELSESQINYAYRDAEILIPLHERIRAIHEQHGTMKSVRLECAVIPAVAQMELTGLLIDKEYLNNLRDEINQKRFHVKDYINHMFPAKQQNFFEVEGINPNSVPQKIAAFKEKFGIKLAGTSKSVLLQCATDHPHTAEAVTNILNWMSLKTLKGLLDSIEEGIHPITKRLHPELNQIGQEQHRMGCSDPNMKQVPRPDTYGEYAKFETFKSEMNFRKCVVAALGRKFSIFDYSSNQLRIIAQLANDPTLKKIFIEKLDAHRFMASKLYNKPEDLLTKEERQSAKPVNYGYGFGAGVDRIQKQRIENMRRFIEKAIIQHERNTYFNTYTRVKPWQYENFARLKECHYVETDVFKRKIHFHPESAQIAFTEAANFPVCATEVDGSRYALATIFRVLEAKGYKAKIVNEVYDEIMIEADESCVEEVALLHGKLMLDGMQQCLPTVPVEVEGHIGDNWGAK